MNSHLGTRELDPPHSSPAPCPLAQKGGNAPWRADFTPPHRVQNIQGSLVVSRVGAQLLPAMGAWGVGGMVLRHSGVQR